MHRLDAGKLSMFSGGLIRLGGFRDLDPPVSLSSGLLPRCDPVTFQERDWYLISLWLTRCITVTPDTFLDARFFCALPDEYGYVKTTLQAMKNRDRAEIICMIGTRYSTLPQRKGSQRPSRPPEQAFFSSKSGGWSGARRGRGRGRRGT